MPKICNSENIEDIKAFFKNRDKIHLIDVLPDHLEEQRGNCCKTIAAFHLDLMTKAHQYKQSRPIEERIKFRQIAGPYTAPFYRKSAPFTLFKPYEVQFQEHGSEVGEFYNAAKIKALLDSNRVHSTIFQAPTEPIYISTLKEQIEDKNIPAIVFFDVGTNDSELGAPVNKRSRFEHGAVVVGSGEQDRENYFILAHWGKYHIVKATDLAASAFQLIASREETFYQVKIENIPRWLTAEDIARYNANFKKTLGQISDQLEKYSKPLREALEIIHQHCLQIEILLAVDDTSIDDQYEIKLGDETRLFTKQRYFEYFTYIQDQASRLQNYCHQLEKESIRVSGLYKSFPKTLEDLPTKTSHENIGSELKATIILTDSVQPDLSTEPSPKEDRVKMIQRRQSFSM